LAGLVLVAGLVGFPWFAALLVGVVFLLGFFRWFLTESLILAQDERWRRA
jgi:hypothetical protein